VRATGKAVKNEKDKIIKVQGSFQDITEHKLAEEALWENEKILNITGQMAKIGGWELYPETMKVTWTDETYRIHNENAAYCQRSIKTYQVYNSHNN